MLQEVNRKMLFGFILLVLYFPQIAGDLHSGKSHYDIK